MSLAAAATTAVGAALFGADQASAACAALAVVFLATYAFRATAGRWLGAGLVLLAAAVASRLWHPVDVVPPPPGAGRAGTVWMVASLDGERLTGVLLLLALTVLVVAVHRLPGVRRSRWPVVAAAGLGLVPLVVAAAGLANEAADSRWPLPTDPWPLLVVVLPELVAAVLCAVVAVVGACRAPGRSVLIAGALTLEVAVVADLLRVADMWSLVTLVSTLVDEGGAFLLSTGVSVGEPTLADRLMDPDPCAALLVAAALIGSALLALAAVRAVPDR
ncbi:hypothetical protein [Paractinoplanes toevensis]|uniref:Uncharacterized protein n=1 Tax=Paractinoplanes toevensis TaxID=571911 RepID=A0A919W3S8_9ACTN|nr:hypothetical protein [Actinoplanes toevensis]GIM89388.1 hypothetical protein Ato02nite_011810 [Actinoplanes toevensis]